MTELMTDNLPKDFQAKLVKDFPIKIQMSILWEKSSTC